MVIPHPDDTLEWGLALLPRTSSTRRDSRYKQSVTTLPITVIRSVFFISLTRLVQISIGNLKRPNVGVPLALDTSSKIDPVNQTGLSNFSLIVTTSLIFRLSVKGSFSVSWK